MSIYGYNIQKWRHFAAALGIIFLPMIFIVLQRETGSALVYLAFFMMFYREGMPGSILFTGVAMVFYFVVGIRFADTMILYTHTSVGKFVVLLFVQIFAGAMVWIYCSDKKESLRILGICVGMSLIGLLFSLTVIPFNVVYVELTMCVLLVCYLLLRSLSTRIRNYLWIAAFTVGSVVFFNLADYMLNNVMEAHQRVRINVLLGLEEDLKGAGYNVHQSEIAIGSGGLEGYPFGRVYGYCVLSIFLFHLFINVGMVLGLTPVIGIPLPFFSYGGSSLWGFTILLFIFLRIDAGRNMKRN